jgi:predicted RNase H-like HicB family nuclease
VDKMAKSIKRKKAYLTLKSKAINGWHVVSCPEFNTSALGSSYEEARDELCRMIKINAEIYLNKNKQGDRFSSLVAFSKTVKKERDLSKLFNR